MNVLFVSAVLPYPLHSGGQIRIYNLLKLLSKKHAITLAAFIRSNDEKKYLGSLNFCKNVVTVHRGRAWRPSYITKSIFGPYPFLMETYHNSDMERLLSDQIPKHDLVHIEPGYVWPSVPHTQIPVVVSEHNVEHMVYEAFVRQFPVAPMRPFLSLDVAKMKFWEQKMWKQAAAVTAVSKPDADRISSISGKTVIVVPNGVDLSSFPFIKRKANTPKHFLYVGNFKWMENRDAGQYLQRTLWPEIKKQYPQASLRIVGEGAPDGPVEHIQDEYNRADIMLAPIRIGGGTKFKILEAFATGLPVVTTTIGAAGLSKDVLWIADTPQETVRSIGEVMTDTVKVRKARALVEKEYSWDTIAVKLDRVWNSLS